MIAKSRLAAYPFAQNSSADKATCLSTTQMSFGRLLKSLKVRDQSSSFIIHRGKNWKGNFPVTSNSILSGEY